MQLTAAKKVAKKKAGGLSRLKTGKPAESSAAAEESKGGEDVAALKAQIARLESELQA